MQPVPARAITVVGHGEIAVAPDEAYLSVGVRAQATTAREASDQASAAMRSLLDILQQRGIELRDIQTGHLMVRPEYQHNPDGMMQRVGHSAMNTVRVTVRDLEALGALLDGLVDAAGDLVSLNGVNFGLRDPTVTQDQARSKAIADARRQAELLAREAGVTLGAVQRIGPAGDAPPMRMYSGAAMAMSRGAGPMPVEAGEMTTSIDLEVMFAIA